MRDRLAQVAYGDARNDVTEAASKAVEHAGHAAAVREPGAQLQLPLRTALAPQGAAEKSTLLRAVD